MLQLLIRFELAKIAKYYTTKTVAKLITTVLFLLVFTVVGIGIYSFFMVGFRYIAVEATPDIRNALMLFIYELFLLVLSGIVIISSLISGIYNLFNKGGSNNWIISTPGHTVFPRFVLFKSVMAASLPMLIMFFPAILAFNKVYGLGVLSFMSILLSVTSLIFLLCAFTLLLLIGIGYVYYRCTELLPYCRFSFSGLIGLIVLALLSSIVFLWNLVRSVDIVQLFKAEDVNSDIHSMTIAQHFHFLPTHPFAMELLHWQNNETVSALTYLSVLLLSSCVIVALWWKFSKFFYPLWQKFQEGTPKNPSHAKHTHALLFTGGRTMAVFKKEMLLSARNLKGVLWFVFLFGIWVAQIATSSILGHNVGKYQADITTKVALLQVFQYIIAIYFMSSFMLRFVFPSFSLEKKTLWILGSAPLSFGKIFFGKYLFYSIFFTVLGICMSYTNSVVLATPLLYTFYTMLLFVITVLAIVTGALSLGALFPSHDTDDPEAISTSIPGLSFTALALLYGALSDFVLYTTLLKGVGLSLYIFLTVTIVGICALLYCVPRYVRENGGLRL